MNRNPIVAAVGVSALFILSSGCGGDTVTAPTTVAGAAGAGNRPAPPPPAASPAYAVTITADASCTSLPDEARTRSYSTSISPGDKSQLLRLTGSTFAPSQNGYPGTDWNVVSMTVRDGLASLWFQDPPIWEGATSDTFILIDGHAEGSFSDSQSDLAVWGSIGFCPSRDDNYQCLAPVVSCTSNSHRLTLVRQ